MHHFLTYAFKKMSAKDLHIILTINDLHLAFSYLVWTCVVDATNVTIIKR